jgi:hypothetical protein
VLTAEPKSRSCRKSPVGPPKTSPSSSSTPRVAGRAHIAFAQERR